MKRHRPSGYALFVVLSLLIIFFILTTSFALNVQKGNQNARYNLAEAEALNAADSGIEYGLEEVRNGIFLANQSNATWSAPPLSQKGGIAVCFKVFALTPPDAQHVLLKAYGEVVDGPCGDYTNALDNLLSLKAVQGLINLQNDQLVQWMEVDP